MAEHPDKYYLELAEKWLLGTITPDEMQEYARWYNSIEPDATLDIPASIAGNTEAYRLQLLQKINARRLASRESGLHRRMLIRRSSWAAAAILILLMTSLYYQRTLHLPAPAISQKTTVPSKDFPAGTNRAILTLAGGRTIDLDSATNGTLARQGNSKVQKLMNGQLSYLPTHDVTSAPPTLNTLATPRGGQYKLLLSDGTVVWLNAASSITYPTTFTGKDRSVVITGEVYFEVAKDKNKDFMVFVGSPRGMAVDVLGTEFNINAYEDEGVIRTTLLSGKVKVHEGDLSALLTPGQQAQAIRNGPLTIAPQVNSEEVMAWKNGLFQFEDADIRSVMRQLARWYDVEVSYEGHVTEDRFAGKLPRENSAAATLHILEKNQVHFRIEDKKIIVMP